MIYLGRIHKYHSWIKHFLQQKNNRINKIIEKKQYLRCYHHYFLTKAKQIFCKNIKLEN